jgi:ribonucleoside-diphosphate reductase alpha chain
MTSLTVTKRDGRPQEVDLNKVTLRIQTLAQASGATRVCYTEVAIKTIKGIANGVHTWQLDILAASVAAAMILEHTDYDILASAITVSNSHKMLGTSREAYIGRLDKLRTAGLITKEYLDRVITNQDRISKLIVYSRDYLYKYRGIRHLTSSMLLQNSKGALELPQEMHLRVALTLFAEDWKMVKKTYKYTSLQYYTHATPTQINAGGPLPNMSSCFLNSFDVADVRHIYETLKNCAIITEQMGGLGLAVSNVPAKGTDMGDGTYATGLVPLLKQFESAILYAQKGGQKRRGGLMIWIEPWHAEIEDVLAMKHNNGEKGDRARCLFYGLWICDLFMQRVKANAQWSLFCPQLAPGLDRCWGTEFEVLYTKYEAEGRASRTISALELYNKIRNTRIETGGPSGMFKDTINRTSSQQHIGIIRCSNLCTEIIQYSDSSEVAVCNLASISLPMFVRDGVFDHNKLYKVAYHITVALDRLIDCTGYPVEAARQSNLRHRPMAIGIQGLADCFLKLRLAYEPENTVGLKYEDYPALKLGTEIYETVYYAALRASCDLAKQLGPCPAFEGSPASKGVLHINHYPTRLSGRWDFAGLRKDVVETGVRNILLTGQMPTAGTSIVLGNNEGFEPYLSNVFTHKTINGDSLVVNPALVRELSPLGLWTEAIRNQIIANDGSVQAITAIPLDIRVMFKTAYEIKGSTVLQFAKERTPFLDQAQSLNHYMEVPDKNKMSAWDFKAWEAGIKTGTYYFRTRHVTQAPKMTVSDTPPKITTISDTPANITTDNCSLNGSCGA